MAKNLLLFSGGADSAYLAYKLLKETNEDITLLIICSNDDVANGLNDQKLLTFYPLLKELKKIRDFKVLYHKAEKNLVDNVKYNNWFNYSVKKFKTDFENGVYDNFVTACSWEQNNGYFMKNSKIKGIRPYFEAKYLFETTVSRGKFWAPLIENDFHENYNRYHVNVYLPDNLKKLSISCLNANFCGKCGKCLYDKKVRECIAAGYTAKDIEDWTTEKSRYYSTGDRDIAIIYWIHPEMGSIYNTRTGISIPEKSFQPFVVENIESFREWVDTFEYFPPTDWTLGKWGLDKSDWSPPPLV